jgi:hypothetical protein
MNYYAIIIRNDGLIGASIGPQEPHVPKAERVFLFKPTMDINDIEDPNIRDLAELFWTADIINNFTDDPPINKRPRD